MKRLFSLVLTVVCIFVSLADIPAFSVSGIAVNSDSSNVQGKAPSSADLSKEASTIVNGVKSICTNGAPGPLAILDPAWIGLASGDEDCAYPSVFAALRAYGTGKVAAVGQETILSDDNISTLDNMKFMVNIIKCLNSGNLTAKKIGVLSGHREWLQSSSMNKLSAQMSKEGFTLENIPSEVTKKSIENDSIIIVGNAWKTFTQSEKQVLKDFVSNGGGLMLFGLGWSYSAYNSGSEYPMDILGNEFGVKFDNSVITDKDNLLNGSVVLHTFYPNIKFRNLDEAISDMTKIATEHSKDLGTAFESNKALFDDFIYDMSVIAFYENYLTLNDKARDQIYQCCKTLAEKYPQYFTKDTVFDYNSLSKIAWVREKFFRVWIDAVALSPNIKSQIAALGHFKNKYLDLWNGYSIYIADNSSLDDAQLGVIKKLLDSIPKSYQNIRLISVADFLGSQPAKIALEGNEGKINIFGSKVGELSENSFTNKVSPGVSDLFSLVVAHEINHVVDAAKSKTNTKYAETKARLIKEAGDEADNYLRLQDTGFFTNAPQEFFASISNQWFGNSMKTIELGIEYLKSGKHYQIDQALFFADAYSNGSTKTYFYSIDTTGKLVCETVTVGRDAKKRITSLTYKGKKYCFTLDVSGNVKSYYITKA